MRGISVCESDSRERCPGVVVGTGIPVGGSAEASLGGRIGSRLAVLGREPVRPIVAGTGDAGPFGEGPFKDALSVFWREGGSEGGGKDCTRLSNCLLVRRAAF